MKGNKRSNNWTTVSWESTVDVRKCLFDETGITGRLKLSIRADWKPILT